MYDAKNISYSGSTLGMLSFSKNNFAEGEQTSLYLLTTPNTYTNYNGIYRCMDDGYLYIAYNRTTAKIVLYDAIKKPSNDYNIVAIKNLPIEAKYTGYYLYNASNNFKITAINEDRFVIEKYSVEKGKKYLLYSPYYKINATNYAIASFSTSDFAVDAKTYPIIIENDKESYSDYNVYFSPIEDGYIYLASVTNNSSEQMKIGCEFSIFNKYNYKYLQINEDPIKIQLFGDSITDESWRTDKTQWSTLFTKYIPQCNFDIINSAIGSSRIGHGYVNQQRKYAELQYNYVYDLIINNSVLRADNNIIVVFVGTNDWNANTPLGQLGDSTTDTFYGSIKLICEYLTTNTTAKLLVCTPIARNYETDRSKDTNLYGEVLNASNKTLRDFSNALIETCNIYQIPVIDLYNNLGWNKYNVLNYTQDGVHPTPMGSDIIAKYIASIIKNHLGL